MLSWPRHTSSHSSELTRKRANKYEISNQPRKKAILKTVNERTTCRPSKEKR